MLMFVALFVFLAARAEVDMAVAGDDRDATPVQTAALDAEEGLTPHFRPAVTRHGACHVPTGQVMVGVASWPATMSAPENASR
ncbi:MAG: hypothetical protein ACC645_21910 [Pirellulales bacterium]